VGHESGLVILVEWLVVLLGMIWSGLLGLSGFWPVEREMRGRKGSFNK
jgi:hypothetical protein